MIRDKAWALAAVLFVSACNSPVRNDSGETVSAEQEKATESFKNSLSRAFSQEISQEMLKSSGGLGDAGRSMILIACDMSDKPGGGLFLSEMSGEQREACSIWAMAARALGKDERNAVIGADIDGDISIEPLWQGEAKSKGRNLPAVLLEAKLNIVNPTDGFRGQVCVRKFSIIDNEFNIERNAMALSCASEDSATIGAVMNQAGVVDIPQEYGSAPKADEPSESISSTDNGADSVAENASVDENGSAQTQTSAQKQAAHDKAAADNKLSTQGITAAWNAIETSTRADILPQQRAWIKSKDANCSVEAASASLDQTEQETARLKCDTEANRSRIEWLKQYLPR
ncbi:DUF1311 domain-containing protein [Novosphingobium sp. NBM11]|uniref:lysozyme inhibitor LprI family protein n=1 Tax=Novosphingobium sp. NBM11 TaxID=2596914 RepID=UPI0018920A60|nr:lysozyme inhibitor LprI family protein [Novosphingobium sp. NBM11]MBF5090581.1 DUF1311 domain-containing protein [Novosphingobium sp. NBM11]